MKAVELKNVSFSYDGKSKVLDKINFWAEYGKIALVSGYSGSGKSTLMSIISGIIPNLTAGQLTGEVYIDGQNTCNMRLYEVCHKVGVVLQNTDEQIIQKKVEDEIAFACENLAFEPSKIKKQIDLVCEIMKLDKTKATHSLSGGQKQRLITASTLAMGQKIIILDEPLANLDKEGGLELMFTLRKLSEVGYSVIRF